MRKAKPIHSELTIQEESAPLPCLADPQRPAQEGGSFIMEEGKVSDTLCLQTVGTGNPKQGVLCEPLQMRIWLSLIGPKLEAGPQGREVDSY